MQIQTLESLSIRKRLFYFLSYISLWWYIIRNWIFKII